MLEVSWLGRDWFGLTVNLSYEIMMGGLMLVIFMWGEKNIAIGNVKVQNTKIHKVHIILSLLIHSVD